MPRNGYLFEGLNILISAFRVFTYGFQGLSKAFHYPLQLLILICLLTLKMLTGTLLKFPSLGLIDVLF